MRLSMALAACLLGYGEVGLWLKEAARAPNSWVQWEGNPYLKWMEDYSGDDYQNAVKVGLGEGAVNVLITTPIPLSRNPRNPCSSRLTLARQVCRVARGLGKVYSAGEGLLGHGNEA